QWGEDGPRRLSRCDPTGLPGFPSRPAGWRLRHRARRACTDPARRERGAGDTRDDGRVRGLRARAGGAVMTMDGIDRGLAADLAAAALTLARRFAAGATMWCVAPSWEPHAQHIAVEFVHPVIVGKRALPAVALTGQNPVDTVRISARP